MKKRLPLLLTAVLCFAGCTEKAEYTCGNGILEEDEICDGTLFSQNLNLVCSNGAQVNTSAVRCTDTCRLDMSSACSAVCGNGIVEGDEQCDGSNMPVIKAACENPDMTKISCQNCRIVDSGICGSSEFKKQNPSWYPENCGNGQLDSGEICDGSIISHAAGTCPQNMILKGNPVFKCLDSCRGVDVSEACIFGSGAVCGNGVLEGDELCDGTEFNLDALNAIQCGIGEKLNVEKAVCSNCQIESACVPTVRDDVGMIISEVVPHLYTSGQSMSFDGLAIELTNMSNDRIDTSACSIALISEGKIEKKYALSDLNASSFDARETKVLCSLKDGDVFNKACHGVIADDALLSIADDAFLTNLSVKLLLGLVCGNDEIVDLFNLNSFFKGVENYGVDYVRLCDAEPVTSTENAKLGDGWFIDSSTEDAPDYDLGNHCSVSGSQVNSCKYTVSRDTLDNRGQSIDLDLELNIPGITDKTSSTDVNKSLKIQFVAGEVKNGTKVSKSIIHQVGAHADMTWQNANGIDRYVGKLRNWDLYEGFLNMDVGTYTLDAAISFDNGNTYVYCGPKGIISDYGVYQAEKRNTLVVEYDDDGGTCGDGIISSSEVCDGTLAREEALECENEGEIVFDSSKIMCSCSTMSTVPACSSIPPTCGSGTLDEKEVCDGSILPESAKVCPKGMTVKSDPDWRCASTCLSIDVDGACEYSCGNGKLDSGEVCDGSMVPEGAKVCPKDYVPLDSAEWVCNAKCDGVVTETSCELACGNGKLDSGEVCDGALIDHASAEAKCKGDTTYDSTRATCLDKCTSDTAACVPGRNIVFDEFIVQRDEKGKAKGVAISINNYGTEAVELGACSLSLLNENGTFAVEGAYYFSFLDIAGVEGNSYKLEPCKPLVVCSEPIASQSEYQDIWGEHCDSVLVGYDLNGRLIDNIFLNYPDIDTLQISCGGEYIDYFDFEGFLQALKGGNSHGKLKASDLRPWPGRTTADMSKRMDVDKTYDIESFASPVCTQ